MTRGGAPAGAPAAHTGAQWATRRPRLFAFFKFSSAESARCAARRATAVRCGARHPLWRGPARRRERGTNVNKFQISSSKMSRRGIKKGPRTKFCRPWSGRNIPWIGRSMGGNGPSIPCLHADWPRSGGKAACVKKSIRPTPHGRPSPGAPAARGGRRGRGGAFEIRHGGWAGGPPPPQRTDRKAVRGIENGPP